ncbi:hypothetical protein Ddye_016121 [Dipteronia dyeriana]|uniref:RNase H type-1 domain-containing protein n=1 Tax=Dipteronia dyeriana TaxID=168575 RepID=A0AAD9X000_9ROSI|nr:hypothetical protein Ddye_016121 [Dipteronia dyeriana]
MWSCWALKGVRSYCGILMGGNRFRMGEEELNFLCVVLWRIRSIRNQLVHGGNTSLLGEVVPWSVSFLDEWLVANPIGLVREITADQETPRWCPPCEGFYTLSTDTALDSQSKIVGWGMVNRDHSGSVMVAGAQRIINASSDIGLIIGGIRDCLRDMRVDSISFVSRQAC